MRLNDLSAASGSRKAKKRVGRGIGSGLGKTCGRGHKGQKSRSGGFHKVGFEGGQMPLQRRLPKVGFRSRSRRSVAEVRLADIGRVDGDVVDIKSLRAARLISGRITRIKVINTGSVVRPLTLSGLAVSAGAKAAIEAAGGKVVDAEKA
jgi:large subunit ribosomal protein L15